MRQELEPMHVGPVNGRERSRAPDTGIDAAARKRTDERQRAIDPPAPEHVAAHEFLRMVRVQPRLAFAVTALLPPVRLDGRPMVMPDERRWCESDPLMLGLQAPAHVD